MESSNVFQVLRFPLSDNDPMHANNTDYSKFFGLATKTEENVTTLRRPSYSSDLDSEEEAELRENACHCNPVSDNFQEMDFSKFLDARDRTSHDINDLLLSVTRVERRPLGKGRNDAESVLDTECTSIGGSSVKPPKKQTRRTIPQMTSKQMICPLEFDRVSSDSGESQSSSSKQKVHVSSSKSSKRSKGMSDNEPGVASSSSNIEPPISSATSAAKERSQNSKQSAEKLQPRNKLSKKSSLTIPSNNSGVAASVPPRRSIALECKPSTSRDWWKEPVIPAWHNYNDKQLSLAKFRVHIFPAMNKMVLRMVRDYDGTVIDNSDLPPVRMDSDHVSEDYVFSSESESDDDAQDLYWKQSKREKLAGIPKTYPMIPTSGTKRNKAQKWKARTFKAHREPYAYDVIMKRRPSTRSMSREDYLKLHGRPRRSNSSEFCSHMGTPINEVREEKNQEMNRTRSTSAERHLITKTPTNLKIRWWLDKFVVPDDRLEEQEIDIGKVLYSEGAFNEHYVILWPEYHYKHVKRAVNHGINKTMPVLVRYIEPLPAYKLKANKMKNTQFKRIPDMLPMHSAIADSLTKNVFKAEDFQLVLNEDVCYRHCGVTRRKIEYVLDMLIERMYYQANAFTNFLSCILMKLPDLGEYKAIMSQLSTHLIVHQRFPYKYLDEFIPEQFRPIAPAEPTGFAREILTYVSELCPRAADMIIQDNLYAMFETGPKNLPQKKTEKTSQKRRAEPVQNDPPAKKRKTTKAVVSSSRRNSRAKAANADVSTTVKNLKLHVQKKNDQGSETLNISANDNNRPRRLSSDHQELSVNIDLNEASNEPEVYSPELPNPCVSNRVSQRLSALQQEDTVVEPVDPEVKNRSSELSSQSKLDDVATTRGKRKSVCKSSGLDDKVESRSRKSDNLDTSKTQIATPRRETRSTRKRQIRIPTNPLPSISKNTSTLSKHASNLSVEAVNNDSSKIDKSMRDSKSSAAAETQSILLRATNSAVPSTKHPFPPDEYHELPEISPPLMELINSHTVRRKPATAQNQEISRCTQVFVDADLSKKAGTANLGECEITVTAKDKPKQVSTIVCTKQIKQIQKSSHKHVAVAVQSDDILDAGRFKQSRITVSDDHSNNGSPIDRDSSPTRNLTSSLVSNDIIQIQNEDVKNKKVEFEMRLQNADEVSAIVGVQTETVSQQESKRAKSDRGLESSCEEPAFDAASEQKSKSGGDSEMVPEDGDISHPRQGTDAERVDVTDRRVPFSLKHAQDDALCPMETDFVDNSPPAKADDSAIAEPFVHVQQAVTTDVIGNVIGDQPLDNIQRQIADSLNASLTPPSVENADSNSTQHVFPDMVMVPKKPPTEKSAETVVFVRGNQMDQSQLLQLWSDGPFLPSQIQNIVVNHHFSNHSQFRTFQRRMFYSFYLNRKQDRQSLAKIFDRFEDHRNLASMYIRGGAPVVGNALDRCKPIGLRCFTTLPSVLPIKRTRIEYLNAQFTFYENVLPVLQNVFPGDIVVNRAGTMFMFCGRSGRSDGFELSVHDRESKYIFVWKMTERGWLLSQKLLKDVYLNYDQPYDTHSTAINDPQNLQNEKNNIQQTHVVYKLILGKEALPDGSWKKIHGFFNCEHDKVLVTFPMSNQRKWVINSQPSLAFVQFYLLGDTVSVASFGSYECQYGFANPTRLYFKHPIEQHFTTNLFIHNSEDWFTTEIPRNGGCTSQSESLFDADTEPDVKHAFDDENVDSDSDSRNSCGSDLPLMVGKGVAAKTRDDLIQVESAVVDLVLGRQSIEQRRRYRTDSVLREFMDDTEDQHFDQEMHDEEAAIIPKIQYSEPKIINTTTIAAKTLSKSSTSFDPTIDATDETTSSFQQSVARRQSSKTCSKGQTTTREANHNALIEPICNSTPSKNDQMRRENTVQLGPEFEPISEDEEETADEVAQIGQQHPIVPPTANLFVPITLKRHLPPIEPNVMGDDDTDEDVQAQQRQAKRKKIPAIDELAQSFRKNDEESRMSVRRNLETLSQEKRVQNDYKHNDKRSRYHEDDRQNYHQRRHRRDHQHRESTIHKSSFSRRRCSRRSGSRSSSNDSQRRASRGHSRPSFHRQRSPEKAPKRKEKHIYHLTSSSSSTSSPDDSLPEEKTPKHDSSEGRNSDISPNQHHSNAKTFSPELTVDKSNSERVHHSQAPTEHSRGCDSYNEVEQHCKLPDSNARCETRLPVSDITENLTQLASPQPNISALSVHELSKSPKLAVLITDNCEPIVPQDKTSMLLHSPSISAPFQKDPESTDEIRPSIQNTVAINFVQPDEIARPLRTSNPTDSLQNAGDEDNSNADLIEQLSYRVPVLSNADSLTPSTDNLLQPEIINPTVTEQKSQTSIDLSEIKSDACDNEDLLDASAEDVSKTEGFEPDEVDVVDHDHYRKLLTGDDARPTLDESESEEDDNKRNPWQNQKGLCRNAFFR